MAIKELSAQLANQIAAGEVIERPSSVIKELVENAIDAHSQTIKVYVEEAGLKKMTVIDDGTGIAKEEVRTAFLRHATSKIASARDLFHIHTLGFRGEALPSIASIAHVVLTTATKGAEEGVEMVIEGGEVLQEKPASARQGTMVEVTQLFYNTPARLKHLKKMTTEYSHILRLMQHFAQSHPEIRFELYNNGRLEFQTYGTNQADQVLYALYKNEVRHHLFSFNDENDDFSIHGFLSLPTVTRASQNYLTFVLNGRVIRNHALRRAVIEGYGSKLMTGRYPLGVVYINLDPTLVDVNVHPTKQEVRLSKEASLCSLISSSIARALKEEVLIPEVSVNEKQEKTMNPSLLTPYALEDKSVVKEGKIEKKEQTKLSLQEALDQFSDVASGVIIERNQEENPVLSVKEDVATSDIVKEKPRSEKKATAFPELEYFGQMHGTYLFAQNEEGLYIIDQHAAQERIKYEHYRVAIGQVTANQQQLLMPYVFDLSPADAALIEERAELLSSLGIELESFGKNSYAVRSHPSWMDHDAEMMIQDLIDFILQNKKVSIASFRKEAAIMMSCKRSIKANHHLTSMAARQLLHDLSQCENPYHCPHGRPVMVKVTNYEIERMFKRIQDPH